MQIKHPFQYQPPTPHEITQIEQVRQACASLYDVIAALPSSRGVSIAITNLEQVSMWLNKSIVFGAALYPHEARRKLSDPRLSEEERLEIEGILKDLSTP